MIDLHAHILPGLDDGPPDTAAAVAMARAAVAAGTRALAATSHVEHHFGLDARTLAAARAGLRERLRAEGVGLDVLQGGEIAPTRLGELDDGELAGLTLGGGPYVLLECPFTPIGAGMELMVAELHRRGFGVVLAHPERSPTFQRQPAALARLVGAGALAQVTTGSLAGTFGSTPRRAVRRMIEEGLAHILASDAHDARARPPDLRIAAGALGAARFAWMTEAVPAAVVAGEPIPAPPPSPPAGVRARLRSLRGRG